MPVNPLEPRHPVRVAANKSGVNPHVLRAWERRYRVVTPVRSEGGQRLYSDQDVERLRLLRRLTGRGHGIGQLAKLPNDELERTLRDEEPAENGTDPAAPSVERAADFRSAALRAAQQLNAGELQAVLERAAVSLGVPVFLDQVAAPAIREIGHGWQNGTMTVGQEHLATVVFRQVLGWIIDTFEAGDPADRVLVATPPGQVHELGALLAAAAAAADGWGVVYLGADLPVLEVLSAASQTAVKAVALSIVLANDARTANQHVKEIRQGLEPQVRLFVGGAAAAEWSEELRAVGAQVIDSFDAFRTALRHLQEQP